MGFGFWVLGKLANRPSTGPVSPSSRPPWRRKRWTQPSLPGVSEIRRRCFIELGVAEAPTLQGCRRSKSCEALRTASNKTRHRLYTSSNSEATHLKDSGAAWVCPGQAAQANSREQWFDDGYLLLGDLCFIAEKRLLRGSWTW